MSLPTRTLTQRMADMEERIDLLADAMLDNQIDHQVRLNALIDGLDKWFRACHVRPRPELSKELSELPKGIGKADRTAPTHTQARAIAGAVRTDAE